MEQTMTPTIETVEETETRTIPPWKCLIHNDDKNGMDHVIRALMEVFSFEVDKAFEIMLEAHTKGLALCKVEPYERAEHHRDQLQSLSLTATIEPA